MTVSPNKVRAAHDALAAKLAALFPDVEIARNPGGHVAPKAREADTLTAYLAQLDDETPEVLGFLTGPAYDLKVAPQVVIAFAGKTKEDRLNAAYAALEILKTGLDLNTGDPRLGGAVDLADIEDAEACDAEGGAAWMAGGLTVRIGLLFTAPTRAG